MSDYDEFGEFNEEDDDENPLYQYSELINPDLTEEELLQTNPIYKEDAITFCWLPEDPSREYLYSVWEYITYTYIDNLPIRYIVPMFGEKYDFGNAMAQTFYLN